MKPRYRSLFPSFILAGSIVSFSMGLPAQASTIVWSGATGGDLDLGSNWVGGNIPNVVTPDIAQWDGSVGGNLALLHSGTGYAGSSGNPGIDLNVTAANTSLLSIDSGLNTSSFRMSNLTVASGAGAFTLGDGAGAFNITMGGAGGTTQTWTNNAASAATINSDVVLGWGGGGAHTFALAGSGNWTFSSAVTNSGGGTTLTKAGAGTATLSGANAYTGSTTVTGGILNLTGTAAMTGGIFVNGGGTLTLTGAFGANVTADVFTVGQAGGKGILNIQTGITRYNLRIGDNTAGDGAVYQTAGAVALTQGGNVNDFRIGSGGSGKGYYKLSGGTLTANEVGIGADVADTVGVMDVTAGTFTDSGWIALSRGSATSSGVLNVTGGTVNAARIELLGNAVTSGAVSTLNVGGGVGAAAVNTTGSTTLGLNLISNTGAGVGTLSVANLLTNGNLTTGIVTAGTDANPVTMLNFNGGTLKATATNAGAAFLTSASIDAVNILGGGGTIDNSGTSITVGKALSAPSGSGLNANPTFTPGSGYIGAPLVKITGGGGTGATAIATVDPVLGQVTGVIITNPGIDYTSPPTFTFFGGGSTVAATATAAAPTANSSGAMTFLGAAGTTILTGTNTYTGATTITSGTLQIGAAGTAGTLGTSVAPISDNGTLAFSRTDAVTLANNITGSGGLSNISTGTLTVSGANSYGGNTVVSAGILKATTTGSLPNFGTAAKVQVSGTGRIGVSSGAWTSANIDTLIANATFATNTAGFAIDTSAGDFTYGSNVTGAKSFTKLGTNTLTFNGTNTYTGTTWVNAGTLLIDSSGSLTGSTLGSQSLIVNQTGTGTATVTQTGGTVNTGTGEVWIGQNAGSTGIYNLSAGSLTVNNWLTPGRASSTGTMNITGGTLTHTTTGNSAGRFSIGSGGGGAGVGIINQTGGGVTDSSSMIISELGAGTYNISGGTLNANTNLSMSRGAGASLLNLQNAASGTTGGLANGGGGEIVTTPEVVMGDGGAGASTVNLDGGTLAVNRVRNGAGGGTKTFNFNGGLLQLRTNDTVPAPFVSGVVTNVNTGGAKVNTNGFNGTISSALAHAGAGTDGGVVKTGSGTLSLTGTNTFNGPLTANGGKLQAGLAAGFPSGVDLVGVSGNLDFNGQYRVAPAGSATKTFGNLTAGAASEFIFNFDASSADNIAITNAATVTAGAKLTVSVVPGTSLTPGTYTLFSAPSGLGNFTLSSTGVTTGGFYYPLTFSATSTADTVTVGAAQIAKLYYTGNGANNKLSNPDNFAIDINGFTPATTGPTGITDVVLTATSGDPLNWTPTLDTVTAVNSLEFTGLAPFTISGPGTLTINAGTNTYAAGTGIVVDSGSAASEISADLALAQSQSLTSTSTVAFTVSGNIAGGGFGLTLAGSGPKNLSGSLSSLSSLTNSGTGLTILSGNNTFTGPLGISAGTVQFDTLSSLGSANAINLSGGTLKFGAGITTDITGTHALNFNGAGGIDTNGNDVTIASALAGSGNGAITKAGAGVLTLTGGSSLAANPTNLFIRGGSVTLTGVPEIITTSNYSSIGQLAGDRAILNVVGGAKFTGAVDFNLGDVGGASLATVNGGIVNLSGSGSTIIVPGFYVGKGSSGAAPYGYGVFNQATGTTFTSSSNSQIGAFGIGQVNQTGSSIWNHTGGYISVARQTGSFGMIDLNGGTLNDSAAGSRTIIGELGTGVLNVRNGGVFNNSTSGNTSGGNLTTALAALTLGNTAGATGIVNLLTGGTISTTSIGGVTAGVTAVFNFNGGTLATRSATATFMQNLTTANVYDGGAVIDTTLGDGTITQALVAPAGAGVDSISASGSGFSTTPIVQITGGSGTGATAVATVDGGGNLTGVTITNPGTGYLTPPAVTITGALGTQVAGTATLNAGNVSGTLTKVGTNTLTLTGVNTYTGITTISAGSLQLGNGATGNDGTIVSTSVTNNGTLIYNRFGAAAYGGIISGTGGVTKLGAGTQTLSGANNYSGVTTVGGGVLSVAAIGNGLATSNIGASSAASANLVFSGNGSLLYTGGSALLTDRGYTVGAGGGGIDHASDVTFSGQILSSATGSFTKNGTGTLNYTYTAGTNALTGGGAGNGFGYVVNAGAVNLGGTAGSPLAQTNTITGQLIVGTINSGASPVADVFINGGTTSVTDYIGVARGNGTNNAATALTINNNAMVSSGNFAIGYSNGVVGYSSSPTVSFNGTSIYSDTGVFRVGESVNVAGVSTVNINNSASVSLTGVAQAVTIGQGGAGVVNQNGGTFTSASAMVFAQAGAPGTYNLNAGTLTTLSISLGTGAGTLFLNGGTLRPTTNDLSGGGAGTFLTGVATKVGNGGAFIDTNGFSVTMAMPLAPNGASTGGLTKQGLGTLTMSAANTYTGNTTVSAGILSLTANSATTFADTSTVSIVAGATLNLPNAGTDSVAGLVLNGFAQPAGIYDSTTPGGFITGSGKIQVVVAGSYASYASTHGLSAVPSEDTDADGVKNGVEYFMDSAIGFTANPSMVGGTVTWPKSASFTGSYKVETSTDLVNWADVTGSVVPGVGTISYTPAAGQPKRFVRLDVIAN